MCEKTKKKKKKNEEKKPNFGRSYLGNGLSDFLQIWNVDFPSWRATLQQIWFQSDKLSPRYKSVKMTFSFFLSIYSRCGAPASWAARHTTVCLDIVIYTLVIYDIEFFYIVAALNILVLCFVNNRSYLFTCLLCSSQSWYRDALLYPPSVCQISRQSDMAFAFYGSFCKCAKRGRKIRRKKLRN